MTKPKRPVAKFTMKEISKCLDKVNLHAWEWEVLKQELRRIHRRKKRKTKCK